MNDKKEMILDVAEGLFAEHGFDGTSTRLLAKEAGVNIAMLSYYFGSKEKLFEAMVDRRVSATREVIIQIIKQPLTPQQKLNAVVDLYADKILSNHCYHKIIHREISLQQRGDLTDAVTDILYKNMNAIREIILEGQQKKVFREVDVEMTIVTFFGTIFYLLNSTHLAAKVLNIDPQKESVINEQTKERLKTHLKDLLGAHLRIPHEKL